MADLGAKLSAKYAGLPLWAWGSIGGAGGLIVLRWVKSRQAAAAASSTAATGTGTTPQGPLPGNSILEPIIIGLGQPSGAVNVTPSPTTTPTPTPDPTIPPIVIPDPYSSLMNPNLKPGQFSGSGYYNPGLTHSSSGDFLYIPDQPTAAGLVAAGQKLYYEPLPGQFTPEPANGVFPANGQYGTPLYYKTVK